ncbi:hypothetical protein [Streptomyces sp. NBC_00005]|uniref:hypothetical protein n=1 Tax=Streptomyces sp. NBC_00005 TaxID=2903609 RepID=UPI003255EE86
MARVEKRMWITCTVIGVLCFVIATITGVSAGRQWRDGERIDAAPQRVAGVIERRVPEPRGNIRLDITYSVGSRHYSTSREAYELPPKAVPKPGVSLCLEVAASVPSVNRLCGQHYPAGDDMMPTYVLVTVAGTIGVLICIGTVVATRRSRTPARQGDQVPAP